MGDKVGHKFRGNQWSGTRRGSGTGGVTTVRGGAKLGSDERPGIILGAQHSSQEINDYLEQGGAKMTQGSDLPADVIPGELQQCYTNATNLVISDPDRFDYAEGFAYNGDVGGVAFLHAWAVEKKSGKVVDNTWDNRGSKNKYYGKTYNRKKLFRHIVKSGMYGVLGGDAAAASRVMKDGGL